MLVVRNLSNALFLADLAEDYDKIKFVNLYNSSPSIFGNSSNSFLQMYSERYFIFNSTLSFLPYPSAQTITYSRRGTNHGVTRSACINIRVSFYVLSSVFNMHFLLIQYFNQVKITLQ